MQEEADLRTLGSAPREWLTHHARDSLYGLPAHAALASFATPRQSACCKPKVGMRGIVFWEQDQGSCRLASKLKQATIHMSSWSAVLAGNVQARPTSSRQSHHNLTLQAQPQQIDPVAFWVAICMLGLF